MKISGTRTFLEIRVGASQSVEVVLHVRRADIPWFNTHRASGDRTTANTSGGGIFADLLDLLQSSVLPRMFDDEIAKNDAAHRGTKLPPELGPGGIPVTVGEKNRTTTTISCKPKPKKKRQRISKAKQDELKRLEQQAERQRCKDEKDVHYATASKMLQIAYRLEAIHASGGSSATLLFRPHRDRQSQLLELKKLSKRILLWCYPLDSDGIPTDEGFLRPELLPMAAIFRDYSKEAQPEQEAATKNNV